MGKTTPLSPALGGGSRRDDTGGQLLRELEALSQALYNAGQHNGRPPARKETPSSPYLGSMPTARRQDQMSPSPGSRGLGHQQPPSPYLGGGYGGSRSRDSSLEEPASPHLGARRSGAHPSPYLGGSTGGRNEPRSPQIVSLGGAGKAAPNSPYLGKLGSRREGGGRPPLIEPVSPHVSAGAGARRYEPNSPHLRARWSEEAAPPSQSYHIARKSEEAPPRSPHFGGRRGDEPQLSPSPRSRRSEGSIPYLGVVRDDQSRPRYLSRIEEAGNNNPYERDERGEGAPSPLGKEVKLSPGLAGSESYSRSGGITPLTLFSAAAALRSPHKKPPSIPARSFSSPVPPPSSAAKTYRLDAGRDGAAEPPPADRDGPQLLLPWHSQGFEKNMPPVTNFPAWLEDNLEFSKKLEAPKEKKSLWNWKPFRAIAHIGQQRFNCMFRVHVHGIDGLPAVMNGLRLSVSWKRKDSHTQTMPSRVFQGTAEFEETLNLKSTVYGTKNGSTHAMKYMPKTFDLAVVALDVDELVLGAHRLDLSRLLPETSSDDNSTNNTNTNNNNSDDDDECDRSWTTSFKLAGKAKGGTLVVTFACQLLTKDSQPTSKLSSARFSDSPMLRPLRSYNSLPSSPQGASFKASGGGGRASDAQFSPALSEAPADLDYMNMEHLSLDDGPFSGGGGGKSSQRGQTRPVFHRGLPAAQKKLSFYQAAAKPPAAAAEEKLHSEVQQEHHSELPEELQKEHHPELQEAHQSELRNELQSKLQKELQFKLQKRHSSEVQEEHHPELKNELQTELQSELQKELQSKLQKRQYSEPQKVHLTELQKDYNAEPQKAQSSEAQKELQPERPPNPSEEDDAAADVKAVHRGHEMSAISDPGPPAADDYDDPEADEDTVEGLADDADENEGEDPAADLAVGQAQVGVDISDSVDVEPGVTAMQAEQHVGASGHTSASSEAGEVVDVRAELHPKLENPRRGDLLPTVDGAVDPESVHGISRDGRQVGEEEGDNGPPHENKQEEEAEEEEEDVGEGHEEQASEEFVKNLADLSRSWAAASFLASKLSYQPHPIREEAAAALGADEEEDFEEEVAAEEKEINVILEEIKVQEDKYGASRIVVLQPAPAAPVLPLHTARAAASAAAADDDDLDLVAGEFLSLLGDEKSSVAASSESGDDSPRALLLQQFDQEALIEGGLGLNFHLPEYAKFTLEGMTHDTLNLEPAGKGGDLERRPQHKPSLSEDFANSGWGSEEDTELASIMEAAEAELQKATQSIRSKTRAKMLEDAETEALMQEWGLNARVFDGSPPPAPHLTLEVYSHPAGGSAIVPIAPPPSLGTGLGPVLHIRDGGSLRSMNAALFRPPGGGAAGRLVMQVSKPVVVPVEMGATSMDILRRMAVAGMEGMAAQVMMAMPLEDITGKTMDQITIEGRAAGFTHSHGNRTNGYAALGYGEKPRNGGALTLGYVDGPHGRNAPSLKTGLYYPDRNGGKPNGDGYMSLEDLAPMAMQKIEALALEGLKVQAEMADLEAPCSVDPRGAAGGGGVPTKGPKRAGVPLLEGGGGSHMGLAAFGADEGDDLMAMAISLDEWMRLDAGVAGAEDGSKEGGTLAILAAHNAIHGQDVVVFGKPTKDKPTGGWRTPPPSSGRKAAGGGFMGDTITLAMLVQLRDPLRNNEPVGAPMMALVQAERLAVPAPAPPSGPRPKLGRRISSNGNSEDADMDTDVAAAAGAAPPRFKIVDVTLSGLKTDAAAVSARSSRVWGSQKQLQTGSRWLVANGMAKPSKAHPALKGKAAASAQVTTVQTGESLWSISTRVHGSGAKWQDVARLNPHIRNPDVIFPNTSIRTK